MNACPLKSGIILGHLLPPFLFNKVFKPQQDRKRSKKVTNGKGRSQITSLSGQHNHTLKRDGKCKKTDSGRQILHVFCMWNICTCIYFVCACVYVYSHTCVLVMEVERRP